MCIRDENDVDEGDDLGASVGSVKKALGSLRLRSRAAAHAARLELLRARIEAGTFNIDPLEIAARLLPGEI